MCNIGGYKYKNLPTGGGEYMFIENMAHTMSQNNTNHYILSNLFLTSIAYGSNYISYSLAVTLSERLYA